MDNTKDLNLLKKLDIVAVIVSFLVLVLVVLMREIRLDIGVDLSVLPAFHAVLNTLASVSLLFALYFIKKANVNMHKRFVLIAMSLSVVFLLSYVAYHITSDPTPYCNDGFIRAVYFILLITHIVLAALILPFILFTFNRAWTNQFIKHKKMARWVFPIWLYVTLTGPVCYLMLQPCY